MRKPADHNNTTKVMPNNDEVMPNNDEVMPNNDEVMPNNKRECLIIKSHAS